MKVFTAFFLMHVLIQVRCRSRFKWKSQYAVHLHVTKPLLCSEYCL